MPKVRVDPRADDPIVLLTLMIPLRFVLLSLCCLPAFAQDGIIVGTSEVGCPKTNSFLI